MARLFLLMVLLQGLVAAVLAAVPARLAAADPFKYEALRVPEGCFVESVAFYDTIRERYGPSAWCRLLQWGAKDDEEVVVGHAVAVFDLRGQLWGWDVNFGFSPLPVESAAREDAGRVSAPMTARYPGVTPRFPLYREDFDQAPAAMPIVAPEGGETGLRDAVRVAQRLGKHRPVKVVTYRYVASGVTSTAAVCVFVFHGRLCVYFPGYGTIPFRARALSVENLRQLQDCIRRVHPGAGNLTAR